MQILVGLYPQIFKRKLPFQGDPEVKVAVFLVPVPTLEHGNQGEPERRRLGEITSPLAGFVMTLIN
jgi:hypothetical protein